MGIKNAFNFMIKIFTSSEEHPDNKEIVIRVKEGDYAGMKLRYGWTVKPLNDFMYPSKEEQPPLVKVIVDVPENTDEKKIKIAPLGKKVVVKIPGMKRQEIELPYKVKDDYKMNLENNVLFIMLKRENYGRS